MAKWKNYRGVVECIDEEKASLTVYSSGSDPRWIVDIPKKDFTDRKIDYRVGIVLAVRFRKVNEGALIRIIEEMKPVRMSGSEIKIEEARLIAVFPGE